MRFALLVVLLLVASSEMVLTVLSDLLGRNDVGCLLAAGADPDAGTLRAFLTLQTQNAAYEACLARYVGPPPPWWVAIAWPALLPAVAAVLFFALPAWKARRGRVVPLDAIDHSGDLRRVLADLVSVAGLARPPRFVVDPAAASVGAVVFGRNRSPTVCLHGGLLARARNDDGRFRAVLLHELAHIRYGDVTITYATVAVWRVFVAAVLLPFAAWCIGELVSSLRSPAAVPALPVLTRALLFTVVLIVLVHLARSDVLRSREIYADRAAVLWGAGPEHWVSPASGPARGAPARALGSFIELWRTHPRWDLRRDALTDPSALFDVPALPMFLTGAAATLINAQLSASLTQYGGLGAWWTLTAGMISAGLVAGVAGIALWRATVYAMLTSRPASTWVRAGLGLGCGMVAGELVMSRIAVFEWLPPHPEVLLLGVVAGIVFAWWVAQCAHLWARRWWGPSLRPAMLLSLAAAGLALSSWFGWWRSEGAQLALGPPATVADEVRLLEEFFPGPPGDRWATLWAVATVDPLLTGIAFRPLAPTAVAVLWLVPVAALAIRPTGGVPRWARAAVGNAGDASGPAREPPPLGRVLVPGLWGGALAWAAAVVVQAYMHAHPPSSGQPSALYRLIYAVWLLVGLFVASGAAAVVAGAFVRRYRLLTVLIAAETAAVVGLAGMLVLLSVDGCVPPLNTLRTTCHWDPGSSWSFLRPFLALGVVLPGLIAIVVAAVGTVVRGFRSPPAPPARGRTRAERRGPLAGRVGVAALCAVAVGITASGETHLVGAAATAQDAPDHRLSLRVPGEEASPQMTAMQVVSWFRVGGQELMARFVADLRDVGDAVAAPDGTLVDHVPVSRVRPLCADIGRFAQDADRYFRVPEPQAQLLWQTLTAQAAAGGADCVQALDERNADLLGTAVAELERAGATGGLFGRRLNEVAEKAMPS
ncbi:M56 family metallopeptidase [Pseudonocardia adelaidensis]|uniref:M56 family metallopeptidase n=1 Tax=Pseudonocardia adelaidensis TaxID=648754 RepID=UPI0031EC5B94